MLLPLILVRYDSAHTTRRKEKSKPIKKGEKEALRKAKRRKAAAGGKSLSCNRGVKRRALPNARRSSLVNEDLVDPKPEIVVLFDDCLQQAATIRRLS
jgi:hypothetical protein